MRSPRRMRGLSRQTLPSNERSLPAEPDPSPRFAFATLSHKGRGFSHSHRWRHAVAADIDAAGFQAAVFLLGRAEDDELGAGLDLGFVAGDEADDRGLR